MLALALIGLLTMSYFVLLLVSRVVLHCKYAMLQAKSRREEYNRLGMHVLNRHVIYDSSEWYH